MPQIGAIARAKDVGLGSSYHKVAWLPCEQCAVERWVWLRGGQPQSRWCYSCGRRAGKPRGHARGPEHPRWKGGRSVTKNGYVEVWLDENDPCYPMAGKDGYILEHRLVMARALGRLLTTKEEVHHKNRDRHDNRLENLKLTSKSDHAKHHQRRLAELELEVERLRGILDEEAPPS